MHGNVQYKCQEGPGAAMHGNIQYKCQGGPGAVLHGEVYHKCQEGADAAPHVKVHHNKYEVTNQIFSVRKVQVEFLEKYSYNCLEGAGSDQ